MNKKRKPEEDMKIEKPIKEIKKVKDKYIFLNIMKIILGDQNSRKNILKLLVLDDMKTDIYDMKTDIYKINGYTLNFLNIKDFMDYK